jgi:hypothetical protein
MESSKKPIRSMGNVIFTVENLNGVKKMGRVNILTAAIMCLSKVYGKRINLFDIII